MKVGLVHFMAFPVAMKGDGPILETIRKIAVDDYFEAIEVTTINDALVRKQVSELLRCAHMTVAYGAQPRLLTAGLNVNDMDEGNRRCAIDLLKAAVDEAYEIGAEGFSFLSGTYRESLREAAFERLVEATREICAYAKKKGNIKVSLEVFDYDVDKRSLIGPAPLAARYAKAVAKEFDNFGLMVDLSHIPLIHETIAESLLPVRDHIVHAHIGNCVIKSPEMAAYGDAHPRFGFPNSENGIEQVAAYLRVLLDIGFLDPDNRPVVSFEVKPYGDEDPDVVIANAKRVLNAAWARV